MPTYSETVYSAGVVAEFDAAHIEGPQFLFYEPVVIDPHGLIDDPATPSFVLASKALDTASNWSVTQDRASPTITQTARTKHQALHLNSVARHRDTAEGEDANVLLTDEEWSGDFTEVAGYFRPRTIVARVSGGFIVVHGDVADASRHRVNADEDTV